MRNVIIRETFLFLLILSFASLGIAQNAKESMFGDVEKMINDARSQGAPLLSPEFFSRAVENFEKANELYINNKSTRDIREKLDEAKMFCARAVEVVNLAKITLQAPIKAREDALLVEANVYAERLFNEGEDKFDDATSEIEDRDLDDASEVGSEAEEFYRRAELKAIKDKLLGEARELISEASENKVERYAPTTFNKANSLLQEVENLLINNRYATEEASQKARSSVYQAKHAIFLAEEIKGLSENEYNWEKLILQFEEVLANIANQFNENSSFETGMQEVINTIIMRINDMKAENNRLISENASLQEEYAMVKEQATISSAELAKKQELEAKIEQVKSYFRASEATVVFDGENLIVRLHGLNFQPGQAIIQPEYFSLLTKVQQSLKVFPEKHILLEGHTDSKGLAQVNKRLSEERAAAVREYLIANMDKSREQITAIGYGASRPVASNQNPDGRALNRRIDIVINLEN